MTQDEAKAAIARAVRSAVLAGVRRGKAAEGDVDLLASVAFSHVVAWVEAERQAVAELRAAAAEAEAWLAKLLPVFDGPPADDRFRTREKLAAALAKVADHG